MTTNTRRNQGGRLKLSNFPITGRVISFNSQKGFGWLRPTQPVGSLPGAHMNGGKVFIHIRDLVGVDGLEADQEVRFLLYSDEKGLGASQCTVMDGEVDFQQQEDFSSFTAQAESFTDLPKTVISIYVENMYIGGIIGKKGAKIKELSKESGAKIEITQEKEEEGKHRDLQRSRLINLTGSLEQLKKVVKLLAKTISEISQSLYAKITFLIHKSQAGRIIGKKGCNVKKIRGEKKTVNLNISKEPVTIDGQPLITVSVFGPCNDVEEAIDECVTLLSEIYQSMLETFQREQQMKQMNSGFGGQGYDEFGGSHHGGHGYNEPQGHGYGGPPPRRGGHGGYDHGFY